MYLLEVVVIRNAGGRAHRAVEDIAILELLTTIKEVLVIHHTYCGMTRITEPRIKAGFARLSGQPESDFAHVHLGCFTEWVWAYPDDKAANVYGRQEYASSVKEDVEYLRAHPLLKEVGLVSGAVYDIETGLLTKVEAWEVVSSL